MNDLYKDLYSCCSICSRRKYGCTMADGDWDLVCPQYQPILNSKVRKSVRVLLEVCDSHEFCEECPLYDQQETECLLNEPLSEWSTCLDLRTKKEKKFYRKIGLEKPND